MSGVRLIRVEWDEARGARGASVTDASTHAYLGTVYDEYVKRGAPPHRRGITLYMDGEQTVAAEAERRCTDWRKLYIEDVCPDAEQLAGLDAAINKGEWAPL